MNSHRGGAHEKPPAEACRGRGGRKRAGEALVHLPALAGRRAILVPLEGFEPPTHCLEGSCSLQTELQGRNS